jgi:hypothetical protein
MHSPARLRVATAAAGGARARPAETSVPATIRKTKTIKTT